LQRDRELELKSLPPPSSTNH